MTVSKPPAGNQGIQANTVVADVLAVGKKSSAKKSVGAAQPDGIQRLSHNSALP